MKKLWIVPVALLAFACNDGPTKPAESHGRLTPGVSSYAIGQTPSGATVSTEWDEYAPGQTVTISGSGWQAGEAVHLNMLEEPVADGTHDWDVTADENGDFTHSGFTPGPQHIGVKFTLTATGALSGAAVLVFYDGNIQARVVGVTSATIGWQKFNGNTQCSGTANASGSAAVNNAGAALVGVNDGQSLKVTAPTPIGTSAFQNWSNGSTTIATAIACLPGAQDSQIWTANYVTTGPAATSTSLSSSANPSTPGESVIFTATVSSGSPAAPIGSNGAVAFKTGGTSCANATEVKAPTSLVSGQATFTTADLELGNTIVRACFGGTTAYSASEADLTQGVNTLATTTALTSSPNPSTYGASVTFIATVTSGNPAAPIGAKGAVTFKAGGTNCSDGTVLALNVALAATGKATHAVSDLPAGTTVVRACYEGTTVFTESAGNISQVVNKASQTITFGALSAKTYGAGPVTVSATATSNLAVSFSVGASDNCTISGNTVTITGAGSCSVTASQSGDQNYEVAPSVTQTFSIAKATPTVSLTWEDGTYSGSAFPASGSVNGVGTPAEVVSSPALAFTYYSGTTPTGTALGGPPTNAGTYTVHASFVGNNNYEPASANKTITIEKATPNVVATGGDFTYNGSAQGGSGSATGVGGIALTPVDVSYGGTENGGTPYGSTASAPVNAGTYTVTATYAESDNYKSASAQASLKIARATPTIAWNAPAAIYFGTALSSTQLNATATGVDGHSLAGAFVYNPAAGTTTLPVGTQTLSALFTPTDGNNYTTAPKAVSINILAWTLKGFYQPVDMSPSNGPLVYNTVKSGSTVPFKFEIFAGATELTAVASVASFATGVASCALTASTDDIESTTTGGTSLRYDATGGQFIQNWQTTGKAGACYKVTMTAQDGSSLVAFFKLK